MSTPANPLQGDDLGFRPVNAAPARTNGAGASEEDELGFRPVSQPRKAQATPSLDGKPGEVETGAGLGKPITDTSTLSPRQPSLWERTKNVFSHIPAVNPLVKPEEERLIAPEEAMTPVEQRQHPIATGIAQFGGGLTSPENAAILAGTGGLGGLPGAAGRILPRLISGGFTAQMLRSAYDQVPEIRDAAGRGDEAEVKRLATQFALTLGTAGLAGRHALKGGGITTPREEAPVPRPIAGALPPAPREALVTPAQPESVIGSVGRAGPIPAAERAPMPGYARREIRGLLTAGKPSPEDLLQSVAGPGETPIPLGEGARTPEGAIRAPGRTLGEVKALPPAGSIAEEDFLAGRPTPTPQLEAPTLGGLVEDRELGFRPLRLTPETAQAGGMTSEAETPRGGEASITAPGRDPTVRENAEQMVREAADFLSQQERPVRYRSDISTAPGEMRTAAPAREQDEAWYGVKSWRGQFPWFANMKETPKQLADAVRRGKGPVYERLVNAASDYYQKRQTEAAPYVQEIAPQAKQLADQIRDVDPEMAENLDRLARGHFPMYSNLYDFANMAKEQLDDAQTVSEFTRAVDELSNAERRGTTPESVTSLPRIGAADRPEEASRPLHPLDIYLGSEEPGVLPGLGAAVREQRAAAAAEQGRQLGKEFNRPPESIERAAGEMETKSPLFRGTEASPQKEMFSPRRGEAGFVSPDLLRDVLSGRLPKEAYSKLVAEPLIEKGLGIGDKYAKLKEADPQVAEGLHLLDNAPKYFRAKGASIVHDIIGDLSREQERLFTLMADADSRENLRTNHAREYQQAMRDPDIQDALRKYRPIDQAMTEARKRMGGVTLDQDYLRRVYEEHVSGIGKESALGSTEKGTTAFDRVIRPQKIGNMSREASAEYHYQNGLHEFGPAFGTKYIGTHLAAIRDSVAQDFISKATELSQGAAEPRSITYNGEKYYRPDIAREMRDAGEKNVQVYDRYDPTAGVKYPQKGASKFLGPQDVVRTLNDYGAQHDAGPGGLRRFFQEQVIGFGFGIPHVANILRRVTQSAPLGAANPEAWVRAWKVAFGKGLRERGIKGLDDPTFDKLAQQGAVNTGEVANLKQYWGGNLNPANWARKLAGAGHKLIFEPGSFGGLGGVDQRARIYIADLVKAQSPELRDSEVARAVNTQLGDYQRANWSDRQKLLSKFMLFPGWDASSIRWVIQHPIKTTVPPALLIWSANQILNRFGKNRDEDASDVSNVHYGDRSLGVTLLRESMGRNLMRPALNYAQSKIRGEGSVRALGEASRGVTQSIGGMIGTLRPDLTLGIDLAMNRENPFGNKELVSKGDYDTPGKILPNRGLEKQAALVVRHAFPALDRMLDADQELDFGSFAGSNVGLPNYRTGPEQRLRRSAAEASEVYGTISRLAKTNPGMARQFISDPDNAALAIFHNEVDRMATALKRIDEVKEAVSQSKTLPREQKAARLQQIEHARQNLLRNADGLDSLLFQRKQELRAKSLAPRPGLKTPGRESTSRLGAGTP
ncbi:MAG: hypothetical protein WBC04_12380 [Candidatus Acidiferrales bacterium]